MTGRVVATRTSASRTRDGPAPGPRRAHRARPVRLPRLRHRRRRDCAADVTGPGADPRPRRSGADAELLLRGTRRLPRWSRRAVWPGAPAGLAAADAWLRFVLSQVLASRAYADGGLVVVTTDAAPAAGPEADTSGAPWLPKGQAGGGRVGALVLSPDVAAAGTTVHTPYDHFSLLRTVERAFSGWIRSASPRTAG